MRKRRRSAVDFVNADHGNGSTCDGGRGNDHEACWWPVIRCPSQVLYGAWVCRYVESHCALLFGLFVFSHLFVFLEFNTGIEYSHPDWYAFTLKTTNNAHALEASYWHNLPVLSNRRKTQVGGEAKWSFEDDATLLTVGVEHDIAQSTTVCHHIFRLYNVLKLLNFLCV